MRSPFCTRAADIARRHIDEHGSGADLQIDPGGEALHLHVSAVHPGFEPCGGGQDECPVLVASPLRRRLDAQPKASGRGGGATRLAEFDQAIARANASRMPVQPCV
jgi:hypothetical protein